MPTAEHPKIPALKADLVEGRLGRRDFLRMATLLGLSATAAYGFAERVAGVSLVRSARAQDLPRGGRLRLGTRVPRVNSPHTVEWVPAANLTTQVVETLTRIGQDNITRPHLAQGWEASDDLRTWTISLNPEARWRKGGRPFTTDDAIWNVTRLITPATGSAALGLMKDYLLTDIETGETGDDGNPMMTTELWDANAIERVDDFTFRLNLSRPHVALPEDFFFFPMTMLDPEEGGEFGVGMNGTGPFELAELSVGQSALFRANPDYHGDGPYLDELEFIDLGDDPSAQLAALQSRQVHGLYWVDPSQVDLVRAMDHVELYETPTSNTAIVQMKVDRPPFDDPRVRLAMRYGVDPEIALQLALDDLGLPGEHHFVCPVHAEYVPLPPMGYRPDRARELLSEAGYPDGIDVEMHCKAEPAWELRCVQAMQQMYAGAGIRMAIQTMPSAQFWDVWDEVPLGFVEWTHRPIAITVLALALRSGVPWNAPNYSNPEFDRLLTEAEGTLDIEDRKIIMEQIQRLLQEDGPIAQPCWRSMTTGMDRAVQNFSLHPQLFFFGNELAIEADA